MRKRRTLRRFTRVVKAQWIEALRSGDFRQGEGELYNPDHHTYCCLGVLGDLNDLIDGAGICGGRNSGGLLFDDKGPVMAGLPLSVQQDLAKMNDAGHSFKEIAHYIKQCVRAVDEDGR